MKQKQEIKRIIVICALVTMIFYFTGCGSKTQTGRDNKPGAVADTGTHEHAQRYHCPMHPTYTSDKPGECPICGMTLVPIPGTNQKPGGETGTGTGTKGLSPVIISQENIKRLGLTFGIIEMKRFNKEIRTSARIAADETRQQRVSSRIEGWVEKLFVNVTGQPVKKGAPLLTIYSPELVAAQQELITASAMVREFKDSGSDYESLEKQGQNVLQAAKQRLKLWEITDSQIERIEKSGQIQKSLTLYAPASGFVSEKTVLPGQKIMAGESLMVITDLSHVWGVADIYEADLPYVKTGTLLDITLPNMPGKTYTGRIVFLDPSLDTATRTLKARIDIVNTELVLKPEMYADAVLKIDMGEKLTVPGSAVMQSGERNYVFVLGKDGQLQPVEVKIGARTGDYFEMISGLYEGDKVVTSANFLIDSESSLKAALEAVTGKQGGMGGMEGMKHD
jgi:membrane fusion protein, copper/silver efflux system